MMHDMDVHYARDECVPGDLHTDLALQEQDNTWTASWPDFWADRRIGDLVRRSGDRELKDLEKQLREKVYPLLFCDEAMKDVKPAIIHGDLWSGNAGIEQSTGQPIIFDPSSSYSHNEAELGIMKMFGGYSNEFFDAYHSVIPRAQPYYKERQDLYEAYHHLNHFVIFGGAYRGGTVSLFKKLITWADGEWRKGGPPSADGGGGDGSAGDGSSRRGLRGGGNDASGQGSSTFGVAPSCQSNAWHNGDDYGQGPGCGGLAVASACDAASSLEAETAGPSQWQASTSNTGAGDFQHQSFNASAPLAPTPSQIADFFSQMVCYIWFSESAPGQTRPSTPSLSPSCTTQSVSSTVSTGRWRASASPDSSTHSFRYANNADAVQAHTKAVPSCEPLQMKAEASAHMALQDAFMTTALVSPVAKDDPFSLLSSDPMMARLQPKSRFLRFTRDLLSTTQVSTSVITLALVYIAKLKTLHPNMKGKEGSEYRLAIASLMLANKMLDDNTYLNKTWAEITDMPLREISKMESEFWLGLRMDLHVTMESYNAGLCDLKRLADARASAIREREEVLKMAAIQHQHAQLGLQQHGGLAHHRRGSSRSTRLPGTLAQPSWNQGWQPTAHLQPTSRHSAGRLEQLSGYTHPAASSHAISPDYMQHSMAASTSRATPSGGFTYSKLSRDALSSQYAGAYPQVQNSTSSFGPAQQDATVAPQSSSLSQSALGWQPFDSHFTNQAQQPFGSSYAYPSSVTGLHAAPGRKRPFETTRSAANSPVRSRMSKRLALSQEASSPSLNSLWRYSFPSTGSHLLHDRVPSPATSRPSYSRPSSTSSRSHEGMQRQNIDDAHLGNSPFPSFRAQEDNHARMQYPSMYQQASAFASAHTPNALTAPFVGSGEQHWPSLKHKGPLQYYSLAAGEPRGVLGAYVPPTMQGSSAQQHNAAASGTMYGHGYSAAFGSHFDGTGYTAHRELPATRIPTPAASRPCALSSTTSEPVTSGRLSVAAGPSIEQSSTWQSLDANRAPTQGFVPSQGKSLGQSTDLMADGRSSHFSTYTHAPVPQQHISNGQQPPPFALDVHAWPLASSATPSYLFPYHLLPSAASHRTIRG